MKLKIKSVYGWQKEFNRERLIRKVYQDPTVRYFHQREALRVIRKKNGEA